MRHIEKSLPDFFICLIGKFSYGADFLKNLADFLKNLVDFLGNLAAVLWPVAPIAFSVALPRDQIAPINATTPASYHCQ